MRLNDTGFMGRAADLEAVGFSIDECLFALDENIDELKQAIREGKPFKEITFELAAVAITMAKKDVIRNFEKKVVRIGSPPVIESKWYDDTSLSKKEPPSKNCLGGLNQS